jgi:hypothetical protein
MRRNHAESGFLAGSRSFLKTSLCNDKCTDYL